jgi:hypothetical protein
MNELSKFLDHENSHIEDDKVGIMYEKDDGQLTEIQVEALRRDVQNHLPSGQVIYKKNLFNDANY